MINLIKGNSQLFKQDLSEILVPNFFKYFDEVRFNLDYTVHHDNLYRFNATKNEMKNDPSYRSWVGAPSDLDFEFMMRHISIAPPNFEESIEKHQKEWNLDAIDLPSNESRSWVKYWSEDDGEYSPDRQENGLDKIFKNRRSLIIQKADRKYINMVISISYSAGVSAESIMKNSFRIVTLIDWFESLGFRCKVQIGSSCEYVGADRKELDRYFHLVTIKEYEEPVNMINMVNLLSPWFLRLFIHSMMYLLKARVSWGLGMPIPQCNYESIFPEMKDTENILHIPSQIITNKGIFSLFSDFMKNLELGDVKDYENRY